MRAIWLLALLGCAWALRSTFKERCEEHAAAGRRNLEVAEPKILEAAFRRKLSLRNAAYKAFARLEKAADNCPPIVCPTPDPTVFPPPKPWTTTPLPVTTQSAAGSTTSGEISTSPEAESTSNAASSTTTVVPPPENESSEFEATLKIPKTFFTSNEDYDPLFQYFKALKTYLAEESGACEQPAEGFGDLSNLTWEQLYGFFAQLAASHPGSGCNLCVRLFDAVNKKIFMPKIHGFSPEEKAARDLFAAYLPSAEHFCSALAPGCYEPLVLTRNISLKEAELCLECTACQSALNALFHLVLLNEQAMAKIRALFHDHVFFDICAEFCPYSDDLGFLKDCFTMDGCVSYFDRLLASIIRAVNILLRPERFCVLDLKMCELNEQPNIMHCLRELCDEEFGTSAPFGELCSFIPDRPEDADAFINVKETKIYKTKKSYHDAFYEHYAKNEL